MMPISICVFCGSSNAADPAYLDLASRFGRACAQRGWRLVYGGGRVGLMGRAASAAHEAGGAVLGVMPNFLARKEIIYRDVPHVMVSTMHERKRIMFEESHGFVVLPGGVGTLEEAVEMLSWRRLELHQKPLVFLSEDDFWRPFFALIDHTVEARLTPPDIEQAVLAANCMEDAFTAIEARLPAAQPPSAAIAKT